MLLARTGRHREASFAECLLGEGERGWWRLVVARMVREVDDVEALVDDREVNLAGGEDGLSAGEHRVEQPLVAEDEAGVDKHPLERPALGELREAGAIGCGHGHELSASSVLLLVFEQVRELVRQKEPWTLGCRRRFKIGWRVVALMKAVASLGAQELVHDAGMGDATGEVVGSVFLERLPGSTKLGERLTGVAKGDLAVGGATPVVDRELLQEEACASGLAVGRAVTLHRPSVPLLPGETADPRPAASPVRWPQAAGRSRRTVVRGAGFFGPSVFGAAADPVVDIAVVALVVPDRLAVLAVVPAVGTGAARRVMRRIW